MKKLKAVLSQTLCLLMVASSVSCAVEGGGLPGKIVMTSTRLDHQRGVCLFVNGEVVKIFPQGENPHWNKENAHIGVLLTKKNITGIGIIDEKGKELEFYNVVWIPESFIWLPRGGGILFGASGKNGEEGKFPGNIFRFNPKNNEIKQLTFFTSPMAMGTMDVSPDGKRVIFWRYNLADSMKEDYMMNADGSNIKRSKYRIGSGRWSPDGKSIVSVEGFPVAEGSKEYRGNLIIYDVATDSIKRIKTQAMPSDPTFSPDGKQILFNGTWSGLYVINIDGTGERCVLPPTREGNNDLHPDWAA